MCCLICRMMLCRGDLPSSASPAGAGVEAGAGETALDWGGGEAESLLQVLLCEEERGGVKERARLPSLEAERAPLLRSTDSRESATKLACTDDPGALGWEKELPRSDRRSDPRRSPCDLPRWSAWGASPMTGPIHGPATEQGDLCERPTTTSCLPHTEWRDEPEDTTLLSTVRGAADIISGASCRVAWLPVWQTDRGVSLCALCSPTFGEPTAPRTEEKPVKSSF
jgi:hypothetical protein